MATSKILYLPFILTGLICFLNNPSYAQSEWERDKEIRNLIDENRACEESLRECYENSKSLIVQIEEKEEELELLVGYLKELRQENAQSEPVVEAPKEEGTPTTLTPTTLPASNEPSQVIAGYENKVAALKGQISGYISRAVALKGRITELLGEISDKDREIEDKKARIREQADSINILSGQLQRTADTLEQVRSVLSCVQSFQEKKGQNKKNARQDIERANSAYEFYSNHLDKRLGLIEEGLDSLNYAWAIYSQYGALSCDSTSCRSFYGDKPILLSYCEDYLGGYENYIVARIVAYNPEVITKSLEDQGLGDKINQLNEMLLSNIGQALKKGIYNVRSDTKKLVEELPEIMEQLSTLIIQERKEGLNTEVKNWIEQITKEYHKKNYAKAISIYNTYQRLFKIGEFQLGDYPQHILSAKYCAGTILLWNLGDISENEGLVHHSSWLGKSLKDREFSGISLLNEIPTELSPLKGIKENWQLDLLRKTYVSLGKRYE